MSTANVSGSIALLILALCHRVQTNAYAAVLTYRQHFSYTIWRNLAGHVIRALIPHVRSSFGRTAKFEMWPIRHWGGEVYSNPSLYMKYRISTSNERVLCTTQVAKLSFNHSLGRTHSFRFSIFSIFSIFIYFLKNVTCDYGLRLKERWISMVHRCSEYLGVKYFREKVLQVLQVIALFGLRVLRYC